MRYTSLLHLHEKVATQKHRMAVNLHCYRFVFFVIYGTADILHIFNYIRFILLEIFAKSSINKKNFMFQKESLEKLRDVFEKSLHGVF